MLLPYLVSSDGLCVWYGYCDVNGCSCEEWQIYNECGVALDKLTEKQAERMVNVIGQWAKEHPIKTRQSEFLKMFPNAALLDGILTISPCKIDKNCDGTKNCSMNCADCARDYWMQEVE